MGAKHDGAVRSDHIDPYKTTTRRVAARDGRGDAKRLAELKCRGGKSFRIDHANFFDAAKRVTLPIGSLPEIEHAGIFLEFGPGAGQVRVDALRGGARQPQRTTIKPEAASANSPTRANMVADEEHGPSAASYFLHFAETLFLEFEVADRQHFIH